MRLGLGSARLVCSQVCGCLCGKVPFRCLLFANSVSNAHCSVRRKPVRYLSSALRTVLVAGGVPLALRNCDRYCGVVRDGLSLSMLKGSAGLDQTFPRSLLQALDFASAPSCPRAYKPAEDFASMLNLLLLSIVHRWSVCPHGLRGRVPRTHPLAHPGAYPRRMRGRDHRG